WRISCRIRGSPIPRRCSPPFPIQTPRMPRGFGRSPPESPPACSTPRQVVGSILGALRSCRGRATSTSPQISNPRPDTGWPAGSTMSPDRWRRRRHRDHNGTNSPDLPKTDGHGLRDAPAELVFAPAHGEQTDRLKLRAQPDSVCGLGGGAGYGSVWRTTVCEPRRAIALQTYVWQFEGFFLLWGTVNEEESYPYRIP